MAPARTIRPPNWIPFGLIKDILRHPFEGIGKPEPLKRNLQGFWSRRIDDTHGT